MVRDYKRISKRGNWTKESMDNAMEAVKLKKMGCPKAAKEYGVPQTTLERRLKTGISEIHSLGPKKPVFTADQEKELLNHILEMEKSLHGLTLTDARRLAFQYAERNNISHPFSKIDQIAGEGWMECFRKRHKCVTLREPEATSGMRARGFNRPMVKQFFDLLFSLQEKYKFTPSRIYNVDETGISTVPNRQSKILALKGKRQVGQKTSGERGTLTTLEICMSASGIYVPPMFIFPRVRSNPILSDGIPQESLVKCHPSGWMQTDLFTEWMEHFIKFTKPSKEAPILLILDGHSTHTKNLNALLMAKDYNVHILCLPPHTTHKLQPLDVSFMFPLSAFYEQECRAWLRNNPGRQITIYQVGKLFGTAYIRACTAQTAINGFKKTGIYPFNPDIFTDADFAASEETDCPINPDTPENGNQSQPGPSSASVHVSPSDILPVPSTKTTEPRLQKRGRGRARGSTAVLTASPNIKIITDNNNSTITPTTKRKLFPQNLNNKEIEDNSSSDDYEELLDREIIEAKNNTPYQPNFNFNNIKLGSFLLVKVCGGQHACFHYRYVVQTLKIESQNVIKVKGMRCMNAVKTKFYFEESDEFEIDYSDIIHLLTPPNETYSNRKMVYKFEGAVDIFQKVI